MCKYPDAAVLLEDVRRARQWRAWLVTGGAAIVLGLLVTIFGWLFAVGTEVGATERDIAHVRESITDAQSERNELRRDALRVERENALRFEQIQKSLHGLENQIGRVEQRVEDMNPRRRSQR